LKLDGIQAGYNGMPVLFDINVQINEGEMVAVLGANGAGKSTILRVITGLLHPTAGAVKFREDPIHGLPPHEIVQREIVFVPQRRRIFGGLTVRENLELGAYTHRRDRQPSARTWRWSCTSFPNLRRGSASSAEP